MHDNLDCKHSHTILYHYHETIRVAIFLLYIHVRFAAFKEQKYMIINTGLVFLSERAIIYIFASRKRSWQKDSAVLQNVFTPFTEQPSHNQKVVGPRKRRIYTPSPVPRTPMQCSPLTQSLLNTGAHATKRLQLEEGGI